MFKKLIVTALMSATFLGGYYLGRQPGSPDIFAHLEDGYHQAAEVTGAIGRALGDSDDGSPARRIAEATPAIGLDDHRPQ